MNPSQTIDAFLAIIRLPDSIERITGERPAFHLPVIDDRRLAYFLARESVDAVRLVEQINHSITDAGFELQYCEKSDFYYSGEMGNLGFRIDGSPEGLSARFDALGRPVETSRTWQTIPKGRLVITFVI